MKAKTINEIKRGEEPLKSMAVGKTSILKGYIDLLNSHGKEFFVRNKYKTLPKSLTTRLKALFEENGIEFSDHLFLSDDKLVAEINGSAITDIWNELTPDKAKRLSDVNLRSAPSMVKESTVMTFIVFYNFDMGLGSFRFEILSVGGSVTSRAGKIIRYK